MSTGVAAVAIAMARASGVIAGALASEAYQILLGPVPANVASQQASNEVGAAPCAGLGDVRDELVGSALGCTHCQLHRSPREITTPSV